MITILHTEASRQWGGQEQRLLLEAVGLKERGYRIIVACRPDSCLFPRAGGRGIEVRRVNMRSAFSPRVSFELVRIIRREKVDIVNTHSSKDSWLASPAARFMTRAKVIRTRHVSIPIPRHPLNFVYRLPHRIISCGDSMKEAMIKNNGFPAEKIVSIPTGVDLERFDFTISGAKVRGEWGVKPGTPLVGTLGIIRSEKGHAYFVEAAERILRVKPEVKFVIVGNEPKGNTLIRRIKAGGLERKIIMAGLREDIPEVLAALDIFVLPSLREGVPQSIAQALAMKKPVVATSVGGVLELVKDKETGILVPPADDKALAGAVEMLLENKEKAKFLGENGRRLVEEKFSLEIMLEKLEALYKDLLGQ